MYLKASFLLLKLNKFKSLFFILFTLTYVKFGGASIPHFCLFEEFLDLKCSFCGITKSLEEILKLNLIEAFIINPLSLFVFLFFVLKFIFQYFQRLDKIILLERGFLIICLFQFIYSNEFFLVFKFI